MRIVFMGTPEFAVPALTALINSVHELVGVVCQPDRERDRGKRMMPPPIKRVAVEHDIPVWQPEKPNRHVFVDELSALQPDLMVVAAYGHILKPRILELSPYGCVNIHASLLPRYRGAAPIYWAVYNGEKETGITIMQMDEGMDTGDILLQKKLPIQPNETIAELEHRMANLGAECLIEWLSLVDNNQTIVAQPQNHDSATHAPKITKDDYILDWGQSAEQIHNHVRSSAPKPGLKTRFNDQVDVKIIETRLGENDESSTEPGRIRKIDPQRGILVAAGQGQIWVTRIHPVCRKSIPADAFVRGYNVEINHFFNNVEV